MKKVLIAALAVLACLALASCSTLKDSSSSRVAVSGSGIVYLEADMVKFSINVSETADTTAEAQQLANKKMSKILEIVRAHGAGEQDISTTALNFSTQYYWEDNRQVKAGEQVSQTVYVTLKDINEFSALADDLGKNISGISFYNVSFDSTQKVVASRTARELAYQDALSKAESYAKQAGLQVTGPIEINEGYISYSNANYKRSYAEDMVVMMEGATATYGTETPIGLLTAQVDVSVTFGLR